MMDCFADTQSISNVDIETVERLTRGQSNNEVWRQLKHDKLTASNFYNAAVRRKEPDKLLKNIMYISEKKKSIESLEYAEGNTLLQGGGSWNNVIKGKTRLWCKFGQKSV